MSDPFLTPSDAQLDLRLGEPEILQQFWKTAILPKPHKLSSDLKYQLNSGHPKLVEMIYKMHEKAGNVKDLNKYFVIVTPGATAGLLTVLQTLKLTPSIPTPHYPRFKDLIDSTPLQKQYAYILSTSPNNPDGKLFSGESTVSDSCYNWEHYYNLTDPLPQNDAPIQVYSMSKLSGHASMRIGWILVKDFNLSSEMAIKTEKLFSGISLDAQQKAVQVLEFLALGGNGFFERNRIQLSNRNSTLKALLGNDMLSERGMFLYMKDMQIPVSGVPGEAFGDVSGRMRFNIACNETKFATLIREVANKYNGGSAP